MDPNTKFIYQMKFEGYDFIRKYRGKLFMRKKDGTQAYMESDFACKYFHNSQLDYWLHKFKKFLHNKKLQKLTELANKHGIKGEILWTEPMFDFDGGFHLAYEHKDGYIGRVDMGRTPADVRKRIKQRAVYG